MPPIVLETDDLAFEHPTTGNTLYSVADPLEFILNLTRDGLLDVKGKPVESPEVLHKLKQRTVDAFQFPSLTYRQLIQIINAVGAYVTAMQKKTPVTPTSPPATDSSQAIPATE